MFQRTEDEDADRAPEVTRNGMVVEVVQLSPANQLALARDLLGEAPRPPITDYIRRVREEYWRTRVQ